MAPYEDMGRRLKASREAKGWSQSDLARRIGNHSSAICHWEVMSRTPSIRTLRKLCRVLNVSADYIIGLN